MSQHAIPLADTTDLGRLARRTTVVRVVLLLAILAAIGLCIARERRGSTSARQPLLGPGASGVVVLDISSSTDSAPPREIPGVLRHLANAGGRSGLVLFSDVAYEALPLGATSEELRPFLRYFRRPALPPHRCRRRTAASRGRRRSSAARRRGRARSARAPGSRPGSRARAGWCSRSRSRERRAPRQRPQRLAVRHRRARADAATLQARRDPPAHRRAPPDGREPRASS